MPIKPPCCYEFGIPCSTLQGRVTGGRQNRREIHEGEQHLSNAEEQRIVEACLRIDDMGPHVNFEGVRQYSESIYRTRVYFEIHSHRSIRYQLDLTHLSDTQDS